MKEKTSSDDEDESIIFLLVLLGYIRLLERSEYLLSYKKTFLQWVLAPRLFFVKLIWLCGKSPTLTNTTFGERGVKSVHILTLTKFLTIVKEPNLF